jgi:hypothetical protein
VTQLKAESLAAHARYGSAALREKTKAFAGALNELNLSEAISRFGRLMAHRGPVLNSRSELRCKMAVRLGELAHANCQLISLGIERAR